MPPLISTKDRSRYLIRATGARKLTDIIDELKNDSTVELLDTLGPANQPHTIVVAISHDKAHSLEQRFATSQEFKIEPDRPLSLFGKAEIEDE